MAEEALGSSGSGSSGGNGATSNSIVIDLSAMGGLAPNYWGDADRTTTLPQRRILQDENTLAEGFFNPWLRQGYLSPAIGTTQAITFSGTAPTNVLSSRHFDAVNSTVYFGELGRSLYSASSLDSLTLTNKHMLDTGMILDDLEIYEINGVRQLFYTYSMASTTITAVAATDIITAANGHFANGTIVQFSNTGGALPTGISANTNYYIVSNSGGLTFKISTALGGSPVDITGTGSGTNTMTGVNGLGGCGISPLDGSTFTDNWITGTNSNTVINPINLSNNTHYLRLGNDGYMYIMDGNVVHRVDGSVLGGAGGTLTPQVYSVLPYWMITDAISYRQQMFIAAKDNSLSQQSVSTARTNYNANAFVAVWDMSASATETKDIITIPSVISIQKLYIAPNGKLRALCVASNGMGKMMEYDGTEFSLVKQLDLGSAPQFPDAFNTNDMLTIWTGNNGSIYCHGQVLGAGPEVLATIGYFVAPGSSPRNNIAYAGAVAFGGGTDFSASSGLRQDRQGLTIAYYDGSTSPAVVRIYPFDKGSINSVSQNALAGNIYSGVHFLSSSTASFYTGTRFLSQMSTVSFINIFMANGNGGTPDTATYATVRIFFNGSSTQWGSGKTITGDDINRGYKRIEINQPYVNTIQLKIEYATNTLVSDTNTFHPHVAMVYYAPTNTRGGKS